MSEFDFTYDFVFPNGSFDLTEFQKGPSPNDSGLQAEVEHKVQLIVELCNDNKGLHKMSTYLTYNSLRYRVTVHGLN